MSADCEGCSIGSANKDDGTVTTASDPITSNSTCGAGSGDEDTIAIASDTLMSTFGAGVGFGAVTTTNSVADADVAGSDGTGSIPISECTGGGVITTGACR